MNRNNSDLELKRRAEAAVKSLPADTYSEDEMNMEELEGVSGGLNQQPLPPGTVNSFQLLMTRARTR